MPTRWRAAYRSVQPIQPASATTNIVSLSPTRLEHVWRDIETVAKALGRADRGSEICAELRARTRVIAALEECLRLWLAYRDEIAAACGIQR